VLDQLRSRGPAINEANVAMNNSLLIAAPAREIDSVESTP
jgi:hypothetical protein